MEDVKSLTEAYEKKVIADLQKENEELKAKIVELSISKQISNEELICIDQIKILHNRSSQRELSLEEVKKLDYLVKNLRLITGEASEKNSIRNVGEIKEDILVAIATAID